MKRSKPIDESLMQAFVARYASNPRHSRMFQPGLKLWRHESGQAVCGYRKVGRGAVCMGPVVAPQEQVVTMTKAFADDIAGPVVFFGLEKKDIAPGYNFLHVGREPFWDPCQWPMLRKSSSSFREQLRRSRARGVTVSRCNRLNRSEVHFLRKSWVEKKNMATLGFAAKPGEAAMADHIFEARYEGRLIALALIRELQNVGWMVEDLWRMPDAPNGTVELLLDTVMTEACAHRCARVTMGMIPLSEARHKSLRAIRKVAKSAYNFEGLETFRRKLRPHWWQQVYVSWQPMPAGSVRAMTSTLLAFAEGSLAQFGIRSLFRR